MKNIKNVLPLLLVTLWFGCDDLEFPDPNAPSTDVATVQTLVTGAESGLRLAFALYLREVSSVGREAYYLEPADPRYTGELLNCSEVLLIQADSWYIHHGQHVIE